LQTSTTPNIGWIEDSNNRPPSLDIVWGRFADSEYLIREFPDAPENIFKTNRHTVWFRAEIDGFPICVCAAEINATARWTYRSAYCIPEFRDQGIYDELREAREDFIKDYHRGSAVMQYPDTWFKDEEETERRDNLLIGFWPTPETNEVNWAVHEQHFRALACTYNAEMQIVEQPSQIIVEDKRPWISIEEYREDSPGVPYDEFEFPEKAIYLVGNSNWRHMSDVFEVDHIINVPTPGGYDHPLYGDQVATIVLQQQLAQQLKGGCEK